MMLRTTLILTLTTMTCCSVARAEDEPFIRFGVQIQKPEKERHGVVVKKVWDDYPGTHVGRIKDNTLFALEPDRHVIVYANGTAIRSPEQFIQLVNKSAFIMPLGVYDRKSQRIDLCVACLRDRKSPDLKTKAFLKNFYLPMAHVEFLKMQERAADQRTHRTPDAADLRQRLADVKAALDKTRRQLNGATEPEVRLPLVARENALNYEYFDLKQQLAELESGKR